MNFKNMRRKKRNKYYDTHPPPAIMSLLIGVPHGSRCGGRGKKEGRRRR
jgi:hypothetical protein